MSTLIGRLRLCRGGEAAGSFGALSLNDGSFKILAANTCRGAIDVREVYAVA